MGIWGEKLPHPTSHRAGQKISSPGQGKGLLPVDKNGALQQAQEVPNGDPGTADFPQMGEIQVIPVPPILRQMAVIPLKNQIGGQKLVHLPNTAEFQPQNRTGKTETGIGIGYPHPPPGGGSQRIKGIVNDAGVRVAGPGENLLQPVMVYGGNLQPEQPDGDFTAPGQIPLRRLLNEAAIEGHIAIIPGKGYPGAESGVQRQGDMVIGIVGESPDDFANLAIGLGDH